MYILTGDIGGTKTNLAIIEGDISKNKIVRRERFLNEEYSSLILIIKKFLKGEKIEIKSACFGLAGTIKKNVVKITNLPWLINKNEIQLECGIKEVFFVNDLEAYSYGVELLKEEDVYVLNEGKVGKRGNKAVIAAGTGLGEAGLFWSGEKYHPFACEGGHTDFGPRNEEEIALLTFLQEKYGHVSYERIVSGPGIYNIYKYLVYEKFKKRNLRSEIFFQDNPEKIISKKAINKEDEVCEEALDLFVSLYGAEAGNFALKMLSFSGVYVGGGIAIEILSVIKAGRFLESFFDKGRFEPMMKNMPVKVILNKDTPLLGSANYIFQNTKIK